MKIGIVCPYDWDIPGGVQYHVRDLAETLISLGYAVSVLAPGEEGSPGLPNYVVAAGQGGAHPVQTARWPGSSSDWCPPRACAGGSATAISTSSTSTSRRRPACPCSPA
jgi:hypothetical protein